MTRKFKRILPVLCLVATILSITLLPAAGYGETLRFVFLADSRGSITTDLINKPVLNAINTQILALSPRPSFVIFGGDQALRGRLDGTYNFQEWKNVMAPLTNAGIALYTVMGNHELTENTGSHFRLANQTEYQKVFADNPDNGPPGYSRLAYSFESPGGDAFFAVLDAYHITADVAGPNITGTIKDEQLSWLAEQVALTKATHKFLFIHGPYYNVTTPSSPVDTTYTRLWSLLDNNRFDVYFCGHTHLFSRRAINSSIAPDPQTSPPLPSWKNNVVQVLNGTCGAPVTSEASLIVDKTLWNITTAPDTYYFSVVDVSGSQVTVTSYKGNTAAYSAFDSFTINRDTSLLWSGDGGSAALWTLDSSNNLIDKPMWGPYSGWTPVSYTLNPDGTKTLLWSGTGGYAAIWTLDSSNILTDKPDYGPYGGWTPVNYTFNPDGTRTLLWSGTGGYAALWTLDSSNTLTDKPAYGPYSGWTPVSYTINLDGTRTLLWAGEGGYAAIWTLDGSNTLTDKPMYGPYSGWTPVSYAVNPDGTRTLLWAGEGGYAAIWTLDSSNTLTAKPMFGPYSGWTPMSYSVNPYGARTLLWAGEGGYATLWTLDSSNNLTASKTYGPYIGWTPIKCQ